MTDGVPNLRGGPTATLSFVLGPLLTAVVVAGGIIWSEAQKQAQAPTRQEVKEVSDNMNAMKTDIAIMKVNMGRLDSIEVKVDRLLIERLDAKEHRR